MGGHSARNYSATVGTFGQLTHASRTNAEMAFEFLNTFGLKLIKPLNCSKLLARRRFVVREGLNISFVLHLKYNHLARLCARMLINISLY